MYQFLTFTLEMFERLGWGISDISESLDTHLVPLVRVMLNEGNEIKQGRIDINFILMVVFSFYMMNVLSLGWQKFHFTKSIFITKDLKCNVLE